jgi:hypothetical protein
MAPAAAEAAQATSRTAHVVRQAHHERMKATGWMKAMLQNDVEPRDGGHPR